MDGGGLISPSDFGLPLSSVRALELARALVH
jgi:hypothetical protein